MKTLKISIILLVVAVLMGASTGYASPNVIGSISDGITRPTRLALDGQGNLYVSEPATGKVTKFNSQGKKLGSFHVEEPQGIAIAASGDIYVCSQKGVVLVFSPAFKEIGTVGAREGEFEKPADVAVAGDGSIFVTDGMKGLVKVFNAKGEYQYTFGNGHLFAERTYGIAVNDAGNNGAGEVYVVDVVKTTVQGYVVAAPRISVFTKNGAFLRSFGQYGSELGKMKVATAIAVGPDGLLYVADSGNNVVHILSAADGTPVGEGGLYATNGFIPGGVAVSKGHVAYVSWQNTDKAGGRVDLFGLEGYVAMGVSPSSLSFSARQYSGNPDAQTVTVSNSGSGTLNWTATADQDWIALGAPTAAGPGASSTLSVGAEITKLSTGTYNGTVTITSETGEQAAVAVALTVAQPLVLNISNGSPAFSVKKGANTAAANVQISIDGGAGSWSIDAASLPSWLSISPASGDAAPTTVIVTANAAGLAVGSYTASAAVNAAGAMNSGSKVTVSLTVNATTTINVATNNANASFEVSGPASYSGKGKSWSVEDAPAGDYTVTFSAVAGYKKPYGQTKTLAESGAVSFSGTYVSYKDLAARKNIVVANGPGAANDARVKVYKNTGVPVAFDLVALETMYGASVAAGDVDGNGEADLIVGAGNGGNNPATVRVFRAFDQAMMAEVVAFGTLNGASVASADLNGDGQAELIVSDNKGTIAVYAVVNGKLTATGIELKGSAATAADTKGDGLPELVTATATGLTVWTVSETKGAWAVKAAGELAVKAASVAAADTDGDGQDEIIAGSEDGTVSIVELNGSETTFATFDKYGVVVAGADLDGDGKAEIIAGAGAKRTGSEAGKNGKMNKRDNDRNGNSDHEEGTVRVYTAGGALQYVVRTFDDASNGVNVAVGDLGL
jgi:hypothetical protein